MEKEKRSKSMRQRLELAQAIMENPDILSDTVHEMDKGIISFIGNMYLRKL